MKKAKDGAKVAPEIKSKKSRPGHASPKGKRKGIETTIIVPDEIVQLMNSEVQSEDAPEQQWMLRVVKTGKSKTYNTMLRIPRSLAAQVKRAHAARAVPISLNRWILEAISKELGRLRRDVRK